MLPTMLSQCSLSTVLLYICSNTLKEAPIDGVQCGDESNSEAFVTFSPI